MNQDLKMLAAGKGVKLWEIAMEFGVTDSTFSKKLRKELTGEDRERFIKAVNSVCEKRHSQFVNDQIDC